MQKRIADTDCRFYKAIDTLEQRAVLFKIIKICIFEKEHNVYSFTIVSKNSCIHTNTFFLDCQGGFYDFFTVLGEICLFFRQNKINEMLKFMTET